MNKIKEITKVLSNKKQLAIIFAVLVAWFAIMVVYVNYRPAFRKVKSTPEQLTELTKIVITGFEKSYKWQREKDVADSLRDLRLEHLPTGPPLDLENMNKISSTFGVRTNNATGNKEFHKAIDIRAKKGSSIYAVASGRIDEAKWSNGYGNKVVVNGLNGYIATYAHLDSIYVKKGELIRQGQKIGTVGSTGVSTGNHLHLQITYKANGKSVSINPLIFL